MYKKALLSVSAGILILIFGFHFYLNLKLRTEPPSKEWSKEVILAEGSIQCNPKLIKFKNNYIVAYGDGKNIRILQVDSIGKKLKEKITPVKEGALKDIHLLTNDNELYMMLEMYKGDKKNIIKFKGNDDLEFSEEEEVANIGDVVQIDNYAIALTHEDKIEFIDFRQNKKSFMNISKQRFLMGSKNKDEYVLCYLIGTGEFDYVTVKNGVFSEPKLGGFASETIKIVFQRTTMIVNNDIANVLIETRSRDPYKFEYESPDTSLVTFSISSKKYETSDFKLNGNEMIISNIAQFSKGNENSILATAERAYGGKRNFEDIVKFDTKNGIFVNATPISRSKEISLYASGSEDTVVFCDIINKDTLKLYMTSTREDFKKANNNLRKEEVKLALSDTIESEIYSFGYIIAYGMFWILPSLFVAIITFVIEYKLSTILRRYAFIFVCTAAVGFKCYFIHKISYLKYGVLLPKFFNPWIGLIICVLISVVFYLPAYMKYKKDEGYKTVLAPFSISLLLDSLFTIMLFGGFLV